MSEDTLRAQVEERLRSETKEAVDHLAEMEKRDRALVKEAGKACTQFHRLAGTGDRPMTAAALAAERKALSLVSRVASMGDALATERSRVARLQDPSAVERRLREIENDERRFAELRAAGQRTPRRRQSEGRTRRMAAEKTEVTKATIDRIVKGVEEGKGAPAIASDLNAAGIKSPSGGTWNHGQVRAALRASGVEWNDLRAKHKTTKSAAPRKPRKKEPSSSTTKAASAPAKRNSTKKNGAEVTPIDKQSQASGTSRGGSGSRKRARAKTAPSTARAGAKRSGQARKSK